MLEKCTRQLNQIDTFTVMVIWCGNVTTSTENNPAMVVLFLLSKLQPVSRSHDKLYELDFSNLSCPNETSISFPLTVGRRSWIEGMIYSRWLGLSGSPACEHLSTQRWYLGVSCLEWKACINQFTCLRVAQHDESHAIWTTSRGRLGDCNLVLSLVI